MLFGVFPDLLSSVPFLIWRTIYLSVLNNHFSFDIILREWFPQVPPNVFALFDAGYNLSHSIFIFAATLVLLYIFAGRKIWLPVWAWGLHLALDLISHAGPEHGVRLFYPFSDFYFGLTNWHTLPFMVINTVVLLGAGLVLFFSARRKRSVDNLT